MIDPKANKQPKPAMVADPKRSPGKEAMVAETAPSQEMIRARAYELYEGRGCESGQDEQDWLRAEQEILKRER
jgi:hypothetical protein